MRKSLIYNWWLSESTEAFPEALKSLFSVLWIGQVSGSTLVDESGNGNNITITGKDFGTSYIPPTSTATFALANSAPLKVDDNFDGAWFTDAGAVKQVPVSYLINNDYSRTLVKYSNSAPYNVEWIGLLDDAATPTTEQWEQLYDLFQLHIYWSGVFSDFGVLKDNRPLEGQGYKAWAAELSALSLTAPSVSVQASVNKLALDFRNYGVDTGFDRLWLFMLNDSSLISGAGTVSIYNVGSTRMTFPVAPTYTNSGIEGNLSTQYANTKFIPSVNGLQYALNSASRGFYVYKASVSATSYIDGTIGFGGQDIFVSGTSASALRRINSAGNIGGARLTNLVAYYALNRAPANDVSIYENTTKTDFSNLVSSLTTEEIILLRSQFGYGDNGLSMYYLGRSFSQTEHANIRTAFLAHKTRLGL